MFSGLNSNLKMCKNPNASPFQSLMIVGKRIQFTKESFQTLCTTEFDAIGCIQEYKTHCVKGMASMVFNLLAKKFNATFNNLCKNEDAMEGRWRHGNLHENACH